MININKNGSAIVIEFTDNDKYLFNGKMEVAQNELMIVVDNTECVTFRRMATGDILFGQNVDKIQINGEVVTKDTIIDKFAAIGFGLTTFPIASADTLGGIKVGAGLTINAETGVLSATGGGTADSVDWANITSKPKTFAPSSHTHPINEVINLETTLGNKANKSDLANFITNTVDNLTNYYKKSETYTLTEVKNLIKAIETVKLKKVSVLPAKGEANTIYLVPKVKAKKSNIYEEWIYVDTAWEMIGTTDIDLSGYYTSTQVDEKLALKADKTEISDMLTKTEASTTYQAIGDYALKSELPTFDATELFTKSQDLGTLTSTFRKNLDAAIAAKKILYINDTANNVFATITFISKGNSIYSFQAVSSEVSYALNLDVNANTVTIKLAPKGYGFNKYETEYPVSVFELTTESTNNDILRAFSSNDNGVVIPSSGDVFEVREPGAVSGMVIKDSGIVTSRVETNGKIDLVLVSNNLVDDYIVVHNIKLNYNAAQGVDSLAVDKVIHSVIDPALLTQERQATLVTRSELPKMVTLTQSEYDLLPAKDASTYYFIKEA